MIEDFWTEINEGEIHARDHLQFELKSEFILHPELKKNIYKQDVFLFIPSSLQINPQTYPKDQFYHDQTNIIRYKTPSITFLELIDPQKTYSPLQRIRFFTTLSKESFSLSKTIDELKLLGTIFRVQLRKRVHAIVQKIKQLPSFEESASQSHEISILQKEVEDVLNNFRALENSVLPLMHLPPLSRAFKYLDEFLSITTEEYFLILVASLREKGDFYASSDQLLCKFVLKEKMYRTSHALGPSPTLNPSFSNESILYREGLLNRYILDSLRLKNVRFSLEEKHKNTLSAISAGLAMLIYMGLFVWKSPEYVLNSFPFVILAVFLYILKDRVKEGVKNLFHQKAGRWFPDFSTKIQSPNGTKIGVLSESLTFISNEDLPRTFRHLRHYHFEDEFDILKKEETILHYKKEVVLNQQYPSHNGRRKEVTTIFRLNIHRFLEKAGEALQTTLVLDPYTQEIKEKKIPKVYHLNMIIQNSYLTDDGKEHTEVKSFQVVLDKNGIKRVEHLD